MSCSTKRRIAELSKMSLVPCPSDKCAGEMIGNRPLVQRGKICSACDDYYDGEAWG